MEKVDDDDLVRGLNEDNEMLSRAHEAEVFVDIKLEKCIAAAAGNASIGNPFTASDQFVFIEICLSMSEGRYRPFDDFNQRLLRLPREAITLGLQRRALAVAKA